MVQTAVLVYFTFQTGFAPGIVMLWSARPHCSRGIQPPAWLKGCLTVYAIVTALVAFFLMLRDRPGIRASRLLAFMTNTMLHKIAPIMAVIDFVLFDLHRRFRWHYMFSWLAYFPAYLVFVLARAAIWPGPDRRPAVRTVPLHRHLDALGWQGFGISRGKLAIAFFAISLVVWLLDRDTAEQGLTRIDAPTDPRDLVLVPSRHPAQHSWFQHSMVSQFNGIGAVFWSRQSG